MQQSPNYICTFAPILILLNTSQHFCNASPLTLHLHSILHYNNNYTYY